MSRVRWFWIVLALPILVAGVYSYQRAKWKRFAVVVPSAIYRSGQLSDATFQAAIKKLQLRTVICLNSERIEQERARCEEAGVAFVPLTMPADGLGEPELFAKALEILADPGQHPVLVHCSAGVARTGATIALHRIRYQGWTIEAALAELRGFERKGRLEDRLRQHITRLADELTISANPGQRQRL